MFKTITKSAMFSSATVWLWSVGVQLAQAQSKCVINGQEVPCEEFGNQVKGFLGWGIGIFLLAAVIGISATIFWIMMIIHAAQHDIENKAMWIILMVFTGIIGALIYYFVVKRNFNKKVV
ncbi:MAG: PLDc N-terminal domain-containing protein [Candidatus Uhrbacteria bacterium]